MSEEEREAAEELREEAEAERRLGEGGEQGSESGRVEAEEGRVVAEEKRASLRGFYFKLAGTVALPLAFLALIPALVGLYILNERASENRQLIRQFEEDRAENRARFKRSDVLLCRDTEALKRQNRDNAWETFNNLDRTLRILRLERTPEIEEVALESLTADLNRNEARAGGCGDLPSVGAGG